MWRCPVRHEPTNRLLGFIYAKEIAGKYYFVGVDAQDVLHTGLKVPCNRQTMAELIEKYFGASCIRMYLALQEIDYSV
jgi:hypothetical protein